MLAVVTALLVAQFAHTIEVREDALLVDGVVVGALAKGVFAPSDLDRAERVLPLVEKLPAPRMDDRLLVAVAPTVPATTVIAVVRTCMTRGYIEPVTLRMLNAKKRDGTVEVVLPTPEGESALVSVAVQKGAVHVGERTVRAKKGRVDVRAFQRELATYTKGGAPKTARLDVRGATGGELVTIARGLQDAQLTPVLIETLAD